jgi:hypothetical protein
MTTAQDDDKVISLTHREGFKVVPKLGCADPKGYATYFQGIRGYIFNDYLKFA